MPWLRTLPMRMFVHPKGVLGRLGGMIMARMNWDAAEQVIELRDVQSDDKILEVGFGPGVAIQLLLHRAPARIRLRGRRVAGNGASSGGPQRPRVAQRSTSALGADEINTLMTQPGMSRDNLPVVPTRARTSSVPSSAP